jgi:mannose-1-phosphate guanylyltransferase
MDIWLYMLSSQHVGKVLINTHYLPEKMAAHFANHPLRDRVMLVAEPQLLGTAGTLLANQDFLLEGTTLIAHADNLCLCDWQAFVEAHQNRPAEAVMTMMTFITPTPQTCGIIKTDEKGIVREFFEKSANPPGNLANAAVYLVEPEFMRLVAETMSEVSDISTQVLPRLLGRIYTWHNAGALVDIGTPESLSRACDEHGDAVRRLVQK